MKSFLIHIGDYEKKTAHLTACEDGIYGRLLRKYYDTEAPLCLDIKGIQRLVRARTKEEKLAVETIIKEFFFKTSDGYHHKTCDEVISKSLIEREKKMAKNNNERERQNRSREYRKFLFKSLKDNNIYANYNCTIAELEDMLSRSSKEHVTRDSSVTDSERHAHVAEKSEPVTRFDTANLLAYIPIPTNRHSDNLTIVEKNENNPRVSKTAKVCMAMREAGLSNVNPSHPDIQALLNAGATIEEFKFAAMETISRGKNFQYAIGIVKGRRKEAIETSKLTVSPKEIGSIQNNRMEIYEKLTRNDSDHEKFIGNSNGSITEKSFDIEELQEEFTG